MSSPAEPPPPPTEREKIRALPWSLGGDALNAIFALWTFGGSIFVLFLGELGLPKGRIGLVLSLLPFSGALALVFAPMAARLGRKRVFLVCYGVRKPVIALLLLLPWVSGRFGATGAFAMLVGVMGAFAILRALAETAYYPWAQEFVPNRIRGTFSGWSILTGLAASGLAVWTGGYVIGRASGLQPYMLLIAAGSVLGLIGVLVKLKVPGGRPLRETPTGRHHFAAMLAACRDRDFAAYLGGLAGITMGHAMLLAFLPLYVREEMGLAAATVVRLDLAVVLGSGVSGLAWGRLADRAGSRATLLPATVLLALLPVGWLLLPRTAPYLPLWCAALSLGFGIAQAGTLIGSSRLLYNQLVPPEHSTAYLGVYYAWLGLTGGVAPVLAGGILAAAGNGYPILFAVALALLLAGVFFYSRVRPHPRGRE